MSSLPREIDFTVDPSATPARMDVAMLYLLARIRGVESLTTGLDVEVDKMRAFGVQRVAEAIVPIHDQIVVMRDALQGYLDAAEDELLPELVVAAAKAAVLLDVFTKDQIGQLLAPLAIRDDVFTKAQSDTRFGLAETLQQAINRLPPAAGSAGQLLRRTGIGPADFAWQDPAGFGWQDVATLTMAGGWATFLAIPQTYNELLFSCENYAVTSNNALQIAVTGDGETWSTPYNVNSPGFNFYTAHFSNRRATLGAIISASGLISESLSVAGHAFGAAYSCPGGVAGVRIGPNITSGTVRLRAR